jgi:hypothetical protein
METAEAYLRKARRNDPTLVAWPTDLSFGNVARVVKAVRNNTRLREMVLFVRPRGQTPSCMVAAAVNGGDAEALMQRLHQMRWTKFGLCVVSKGRTRVFCDWGPICNYLVGAHWLTELTFAYTTWTPGEMTALANALTSNVQALRKLSLAGSTLVDYVSGVSTEQVSSAWERAMATMPRLEWVDVLSCRTHDWRETIVMGVTGDWLRLHPTPITLRLTIGFHAISVLSTLGPMVAPLELHLQVKFRPDNWFNTVAEADVFYNDIATHLLHVPRLRALALNFSGATCRGHPSNGALVHRLAAHPALLHLQTLRDDGRVVDHDDARCFPGFSVFGDVVPAYALVRTRYRVHQTILTMIMAGHRRPRNDFGERMRLPAELWEQIILELVMHSE